MRRAAVRADRPAPFPEDAATAIGDEPDAVRRLERAAQMLFRFYERAGRHIDSDARERELPGVREWEEHVRSTVSAFVRGHSGPGTPGSELQLMSAFFDVRTYDALRSRGVSTARAFSEGSELVACRYGLVDAPASSVTSTKGETT